jgi:putative peptidoglycan lipid II flippase
MAAFRIPNFLQNLFGEGALSASFIPVYAALVVREERRDAVRVAGAVAALLALITSVLVLVGVLAAPLLVTLIAPGFGGAKRDLTIAIVRVLFPGAGLLVVSAWCLGILNSHRRFLLSYLAPVIWNVAMIVTLLWWGSRASLPLLAIILAWGAVAGSALQLLVQLPSVLKLVPGLRFRPELSDNVRTVARNCAGVLQPRWLFRSAHIDQVLKPLLPVRDGAGQRTTALHTPVSLFGFLSSAARNEGAVGRDACCRNGQQQSPSRSSSSRPPSLRPRRCRGGRPVSNGTLHICHAVGMWGIPAGCRSDCWRRRWRGCIRRSTTRSMTRPSARWCTLRLPGSAMPPSCCRR